MHASNAMFGWSYVDVYPYGYVDVYYVAPTMHGHGTVYVRGDLLHWPGGHAADLEQDFFVQTFWVLVHWPRGGTGRRPVNTDRRPVRKKRPAKRVFFFWFPLRFSDASSRSGLTDFSPHINIYRHSIPFKASEAGRAHRQGHIYATSYDTHVSKCASLCSEPSEARIARAPDV